MRLAATVSLAVGMVVAGSVATSAQTAPSPPQAPAQSVPQPSAGNPSAASTAPTRSTISSPPTSAAPTPGVAGGRLHGVATSGKIPLPGVTVTAQNTLTGKRYSTTTDISGAWSLTIPQNGRYVIRTQFAAFAAGSQEALLNAAGHDKTVNFDLMLASRALEQQQQARTGTGAADDSTGMQGLRQLAANGAQSLSLVSALAADTETQAGAPSNGGAALPSIAGNSDFSGESVAISGQSGQVSPMAGQNIEQIRDAMVRARRGRARKLG